MKAWQRLAGVLVLTVAGVQTLDVGIERAPFPAPASRFLRYLDALDQKSDSGLLDRLLFSWILAGSDSLTDSQPAS